MLRRQRLVVEAHLRERARAEILDEDVALRDQLLQNRAPFGVLEVERDAFLVAVDAEEIRALAAKKWWSPRAGVVAFARLFDLDHARAHVAEQHRAVRARQHPRQVEHGDSIE